MHRRRTESIVVGMVERIVCPGQHSNLDHQRVTSLSTAGPRARIGRAHFSLVSSRPFERSSFVVTTACSQSQLHGALDVTPEAAIFPVLAELGIGVTAYGVLSRGLLGGSRPTSQRDFRAHLPRFTGENRERNQRLIDALQKLAGEKGASASQLAIAWVLTKGPTIVLLIGARTRTQLTESVGALQVTLTPAEIARIEEAVPASAVAGSRYDEHQMRILDSEHPAG